MLNIKILNIIGIILIFLGISMMPSAMWSFAYSDSFNLSDKEFFDFIAILKSSLATIITGMFLYFSTIYFKRKNNSELKARDGFVIVTVGWIMMAIFSSLPFYLSSSQLTVTNSFFEAMSGLTTTGATILGSSVDKTPDIEELSKGLLFWRSFTQFIGGMGIIVFSIAILPLLGVGGVQLFRAEVAGPVAEKITPRVKQTAKLLWGIYVGFVLFLTLILKVEGMSWFDSLCHSFTTIATSGFSTKTASIAAFNSSLIEYTIIFFMFLAATSFSLHYLFLSKFKFDYFKDEEFRVYFFILCLITFILFLDININGVYNWNLDSIKDSMFTATSLFTTTGFVTANYETFPNVSKMCIFFLFFIGGTAGSTTGALKLIRSIVVFKYLSYEIKKMIHPKGIYSIKIGDKVISDNILKNTLGFYLMYIMIFVFASIAFSSYGMDIETSISASAASIGNIGPGLGDIGPYDNWGHFPIGAKWIASFCMLLGRLEIFTVIIIFTKSFWRV